MSTTTNESTTTVKEVRMTDVETADLDEFCKEFRAAGAAVMADLQADGKWTLTARYVVEA